ncbi:sugar phosphate isomerase [Capsulimonas corticalis]|uniref:Sugar phosphate isomerase n=1 Tax=Capsulimonas corticalis TaxID=2219043 RepID=A0A402D6E5_9BACT|nr:sugar phosphate isomerase/epimerase [Capsulimonas corticalis]BDI32031.1 sugar phosphate isomerase [Capsulimonas corticalis]
MTSSLAVQTYTLRDFTKNAEGFARSLEKIRAIGYPAVQLSAVGAMAGEAPEVSAAEARRMLDDNGLRCIATHRDWTRLTQNTDEEIEFHQTLGCDYAAIGGLPGNYSSDGPAGFLAFLRDSAPVIRRLKDAGIRFGYHNHSWEFERVSARPGDKHTLLDIFLEEGGPEFFLELDLYWVSHAGVNPERFVERGHGRLPVIHVKDKGVIGHETLMTPVGEGNLDWTHLLPACAAAGVEWYVVEQDECRRDPFDCLASSYQFLKTSFSHLLSHREKKP